MLLSNIMKISWYGLLMDKDLEKLLPDFGKAIRPFVFKHVTTNKVANAKHVLFMAGSPAAGKTELLNQLIQQHRFDNLVRIDADDFRWWFPYYNEANAFEYQRPASRMVDFIYKEALDCSGQLKLATVLEFFQYRLSDSFGGKPPLYSCGLSVL